MFNAAMCSKTKDKMKGFEHVLLNFFFAISPKFAQYKVLLIQVTASACGPVI